MAGPVNTETLSASQEKAISALLTTPTLHQAAKGAGAGERTLRRWLRQPAFLKAYRDARRECMRQSTARLQHAAAEAVKTLTRAMKDRKASTAARISAARAVLEFSYRATEADVEAELRRLEDELNSFNQKLIERGLLAPDNGRGQQMLR